MRRHCDATRALTCLQLVNAPPANTKELKELRELQAVARSQRLRTMSR